ncbi:hypothetical protein SAMN03080598_04119 [Algoriphagus boritolerans DSM 17298 = JCM 18970]|uniref:Uncharacterized protein n=1 Tax=Algoriphagus boritolerans DSM 17298 = JCM 18970 TaxID=1120964 RepID=A0A1H6AHW1_9BACT|nr:hypothetical protein SAMN03080598_04119 [Algoriphagus boritolerans DSM 17298 = JCM 18970]
MSELTPEQLAKLFPGVDPKNIKVLDINNLSQSDIYSLKKKY